jgi:hypothetical protein
MKYEGESKIVSEIWISLAEAYVFEKDYDNSLEFLLKAFKFYKENKEEYF